VVGDVVVDHSEGLPRRWRSGWVVGRGEWPQAQMLQAVGDPGTPARAAPRRPAAARVSAVSVARPVSTSTHLRSLHAPGSGDPARDTIFAVLEHLPRGVDRPVLAEMLRVARRRVVVAVPFEDEPDRAWGHVRTFDAADLRELGASTGRPFEITDHHGGWLVIDTT
jgi:hypothetical protein